MRSDARKNRDRLLEVARTVIEEQGVTASLRDVARKAGVGLGTLYRHFPTREAMLEALVRGTFDRLTKRAETLQEIASPDEALILWFREVVDAAHSPRGLVGSMAAAIADETSALHASCIMMKAAGARLLESAQRDGVARSDIEGADLFALIGATAWVYEQPGLSPRAEVILNVVSGALLIGRRRPRSQERPS